MTATYSMTPATSEDAHTLVFRTLSAIARAEGLPNPETVRTGGGCDHPGFSVWEDGWQHGWEILVSWTCGERIDPGEYYDPDAFQRACDDDVDADPFNVASWNDDGTISVGLYLDGEYVDEAYGGNPYGPCSDEWLGATVGQMVRRFALAADGTHAPDPTPC